eukprot:PhF_6_TR19650/c0_g1_i1/m.28671
MPKLEYPDAKKRADLFKRLDPNANGMLSLAELDKGIVELWPEFNNKPAIMRAYKATDTNGNGFISKKEFKYFLKYLVFYHELWEKFDLIDTSDDRRITPEEFVKGFKILRLPNKTPEEAGEIFKQIDKNGGGFILFDEFCEYMVKSKAATLTFDEPDGV